MIDGASGLSIEIQSVKHLTAYVDALHKTLTMVQQLEDINSKEWHQRNNNSEQNLCTIILVLCIFYCVSFMCCIV